MVFINPPTNQSIMFSDRSCPTKIVRVKLIARRMQAAIAPGVGKPDVHAEDRHLYGVARGDLGTPDAAQPPYDIQIEVYLRKGNLIGAATAVPRSDEDGPELPYWDNVTALCDPMRA